MVSEASFKHHLPGGTGSISTITLFRAAARTSGTELDPLLAM